MIMIDLAGGHPSLFTPGLLWRPDLVTTLFLDDISDLCVMIIAWLVGDVGAGDVYLQAHALWRSINIFFHS